jgi:hypothetical protein
MGFVHPPLALAPLPGQANWINEQKTWQAKKPEENVNNHHTYPCPSCSNYQVSDILVAKVNSTKFPSDIRSCGIHSKCNLLQQVFIFILNIKANIL